jgi:hypothetical protein
MWKGDKSEFTNFSERKKITIELFEEKKCVSSFGKLFMANLDDLGKFENFEKIMIVSR